MRSAQEADMAERMTPASEPSTAHSDTKQSVHLTGHHHGQRNRQLPAPQAPPGSTHIQTPPTTTAAAGQTPPPKKHPLTTTTQVAPAARRRRVKGPPQATPQVRDSSNRTTTNHPSEHPAKSCHIRGAAAHRRSGSTKPMACPGDTRTLAHGGQTCSTPYKRF